MNVEKHGSQSRGTLDGSSTDAGGYRSRPLDFPAGLFDFSQRKIRSGGMFRQTVHLSGRPNESFAKLHTRSRI